MMKCTWLVSLKLNADIPAFQDVFVPAYSEVFKDAGFTVNILPEAAGPKFHASHNHESAITLLLLKMNNVMVDCSIERLF